MAQPYENPDPDWVRQHQAELAAFQAASRTPDEVPADQSDLSADFVRGRDQVGFGPQVRQQQQYPNEADPGLPRFADINLPPDIGAQINEQRARQRQTGTPSPFNDNATLDSSSVQDRRPGKDTRSPVQIAADTFAARGADLNHWLKGQDMTGNSTRFADMPTWARPVQDQAPFDSGTYTPPERPSFVPLDVPYKPLADANRKGGSQDNNLGDMNVRNPEISRPTNNRSNGEFGMAPADRQGAEFDTFGRAIDPKQDAAGQQSARDTLGGLFDATIGNTVRKGPLGRDLFGIDPETNAERQRVAAMPTGPEKDQAQQELDSALSQQRGEMFLSGGPTASLKSTVGKKILGKTAAPVAPALGSVLDAETARLAQVGKSLEQSATGAKQSAAQNIARMQESAGLPTKVAPVAEQRFGGKPDLGFQKETFSPESQPLLNAAKQELAPTIAPKVAPITHEDTLLAAQLTGRSVEQAAKFLPKRGQLSTTVVEVAQGIEASLARADDAAAKLAAQGGGALTMAERVDALLSMKEAGSAIVDFAEGSSEIGRALNARKIAIQRELANNPSEAAYRAALKKIMGPGADATKVDALLTQLALVKGDTAATYRLLRSLNKSSFWDKAFEYSQANILWAPPTHMTNIYSGLVQQALLTERTVIEPAVQAGLSVVAKVTRQNFVRSREYADVVPAVSGWIDGIQKAADRTLSLITRQASIEDFAAKHGGETIQPGGAIPGRLGETIRIPFKALTVEDLWQTMPMYNAELRRLASQQARREGLDAVKNNAAWKTRVDELVLDPNSKIAQEANSLAENYALHSRGKDLEATSQLLDSVPGLRYLMRFTTTPTNVVKLGVRHSPAGLGRLITEHGQGNTAQVLTESGVIGGITLGYFFSMMESGQMTGLTPATKTERDLWQSEGAGPLMIRSSDVPLVGGVQNLPPFNQNNDAKGRWVTAGIFGPAVIPMMMAAAIRAAHGDGSTPSDKQVQNAIGSMARTFADQVPMLQGIKTTNNLVNNPLEAGANFAAGLAKTFIPAVSLQAMTERILDQYKRAPEGLLQTLQASIPFISDHGIDLGPIKMAAVPAALDLLGRPVQQNSGLAALFPRGSQDTTPSPVLDENKKLRAALPDWTGLTKPAAKIGSLTMNPEEHHRYQELAGPETEKRVLALMKTRAYQDKSDADKARAYDKEVSIAREKAKRTLANEFVGTVNDANGNTQFVQRTPEDKARGVTIMLATTKQPTTTSQNAGNTDRAEIIRGWTGVAKNDPAFLSELARQLPKNGPTLGEYQSAAPLLDRLREINDTLRFADAGGNAIGNPEVWKQYDSEKETYNRLDDDPKMSTAEVKVARENFIKTHSTFAYYYHLSNGKDSGNPIRKQFLDANTILKRFPLD